MAGESSLSGLRSVRNYLIFIFAFVFFAVPAFAQDGIVDLKRVCGSYSEYKKAREQWNAIVQQKMQELSLRCSKTEDASRRQQMTEEYNRQIKFRQQSFFIPVSEKIQKATAAVAKEKNLQAVYDVATGKKGIDITNEVILKLNAAETQEAQAKPVKKTENSQPKAKPATVQTAPNSALFQVQFGALRDKGNVEALVAKAVKLGFSKAYISEATDKTGKRVWRARIPAASIAEAQQISAKLTQHKIDNCITK